MKTRDIKPKSASRTIESCVLAIGHIDSPNCVTYFWNRLSHFLRTIIASKFHLIKLQERRSENAKKVVKNLRT